MHSRIYLIGFMGSGKSSLGKKLARMLGYSFVDLDTLIEQTAKKSIPEIFATGGETAFRQLETETLQRTFALENTVIATGGGTPCHHNNMELLNDHGHTVYFELPASELAKRLAVAKADRPLIADVPPAELQGFISRLLAQREPYYKAAQRVFPPYREHLKELAEELRFGKSAF